MHFVDAPARVTQEEVYAIYVQVLSCFCGASVNFHGEEAPAVNLPPQHRSLFLCIRFQDVDVYCNKSCGEVYRNIRFQRPWVGCKISLGDLLETENSRGETSPGRCLVFLVWAPG